jgi:hypothetical protein
LPDDFDYSGEVPEHDHSQKRQELIIYAIPLTRGKVRRLQAGQLAGMQRLAGGASCMKSCGMTATAMVILSRYRLQLHVRHRRLTAVL